MSKVEHLPKSLPSKDIPFEIKEKGQFDGKTYEGTFVVRVPSVRDMTKMGVEMAKLSGGMADWLPADIKLINNAVAFLKTCIVECPKWFEDMDYGLDTEEVALVADIFKKAESLVEKWKSDLKGQPQDDSNQQSSKAR